MRIIATRLALFTCLTLGSSLASLSAQTAETPATPPPPQSPWDASAAAGATWTAGNSKSFLATLTFEAKRKYQHSEILTGAAAGYGEASVPDPNHPGGTISSKNTEFVNAYGQYNYLFGPRWYAGLRLDGNYDGIAGLDYRIRISPLAGYYLIKETNTTLAVELGPSGVFEKHKGKSEETYLGFRAGERFEHKLTATTKIWEMVDYVPRVDDWSRKYVITAEAGIDTAISKHWSLRLVLQDIYDSAPTPGRLHNDMRLVAGTAYKF